MEHKLQGKTDVPLSEAGRPVVEQAAAAYRDTHIDVCYCSPLIRAVETAEIVLRGREIPIITDVRLEEMGFGICEGTTDFQDNPDNPIYPLFRAFSAIFHAESSSPVFVILIKNTGYI